MKGRKEGPTWVRWAVDCSALFPPGPAVLQSWSIISPVPGSLPAGDPVGFHPGRSACPWFGRQRETVIVTLLLWQRGQVGALANAGLCSEPPSVLEAATWAIFLETLQPPVSLKAKYLPVLNPSSGCLELFYTFDHSDDRT